MRRLGSVVPINSTIVTLTDLPADLLHLILSYYTNSFEGVIKFSTLCKYFKGIGDRSSIWLECDLSFFAPTAYYQLFHPPTPGIKEQKESNGNNYPICLHLNDEINYFPACKYRVSISKIDDVSIKKNKLETTPTTFIDLEVNLSLCQDLPKPPERALSIRKSFMSIFVKFHQLWYWYIRWLSWLDYHRERIKLFKNKFYLPFCFWLGIISQLLACYLLSDLPNALPSHSSSSSTSTTSQLTLSNHFGFICIYIWIAAYQIYFLLDIVRTVYNQLKEPLDQNMNSLFSWIPLFPIFGAELYFTGWLGTIVLLHYKLISLYDSNFLYSYISLPMWICFGLAFLLGIIACLLSQPRPTCIESFTMFSLGLLMFLFPLGFTLIGLYYDQSSVSYPLIKSLSEAIIPLYPLQFPLVFIVLWSIYDNILSSYKIYQKIFISYYDQSPLIKLGIDITRTMLFTGMLHIVLYFDFLMIYNQNKLSTAIISGIAFELCLYLIIYGVIYS